MMAGYDWKGIRMAGQAIGNALQVKGQREREDILREEARKLAQQEEERKARLDAAGVTGQLAGYGNIDYQPPKDMYSDISGAARDLAAAQHQLGAMQGRTARIEQMQPGLQGQFYQRYRQGIDGTSGKDLMQSDPSQTRPEFESARAAAIKRVQDEDAAKFKAETARIAAEASAKGGGVKPKATLLGAYDRAEAGASLLNSVNEAADALQGATPGPLSGRLLNFVQKYVPGVAEGDNFDDAMLRKLLTAIKLETASANVKGAASDRDMAMIEEASVMNTEQLPVIAKQLAFIGRSVTDKLGRTITAFKSQPELAETYLPVYQRNLSRWGQGGGKPASGEPGQSKIKYVDSVESPTGFKDAPTGKFTIAVEVE